MRTTTLVTERDTALVRLYAWAMIVSTGLAVAAALMITRTEPQYAASAEVLIGPTITSSGNYIQPSMPTEQRLATSAEVFGAASRRLGVTTERPLGDFSVTVPVDTQVLVMKYVAETPEAAVEGAKAFAQTYLQTRNPREGDAIASLVSPPVLPSDPVSANYPVVLGVAVAGGLLIGLVVARAWDRLRGRIRTIEDAEGSTGLSALTVTPHLPMLSSDWGRSLRAGCAPLDMLAARVLGVAEGGEQASVLVTGAGPGNGSTPVAALTARALARLGRVVLLVTADPDVVARMSGESVSRPGTRPPVDTWPNVRTTVQDGLHLVPVAEWDDAGVAAARLACLIPELHQQLPEALIVIDSPTAWSSAGLALRADQILLVVGLGGSRRAAAAAAHAVDHCADKVMGLVVTPRRRWIRFALASTRLWATLRWRALMFRFGPLSGGLASVPVQPVPATGEPARSALS